MTSTAASRLAWGLFVFVALLFTAGIWLEVINVPPPDQLSWDGGTVSDFVFLAVIFSFPVVGALIASKHPDNVIGWIMIGIGFVQGVSEVLDGYALYGLYTAPGSLPGPEYALALTNGAWALLVVPIVTFLLLFFPDGRLPSPRWRKVAYLSAFAMIGTFLAITFTPGRTFVDLGYPRIRNPLGIEGLAGISDALHSVIILIPLSVALSAAAVVTRYRRSRGQLRLQMKWLATAGGVVAATYGTVMVATLLTEVAGPSVPAWVSRGQDLVPLSFGMIPLAMGAAILRHRLYDIDVIINRALVYGGLTTALTAIYLLGVTLFQRLFQPLAGDSSLSIAGSTLAVAALFGPARRAIQRFIDRRFYRQRYDAAQTLQSFSAHLKDEIDLSNLSSAMCGVVSEAMQPAHVSLWLREAPQPQPQPQPQP
ncbi:MAG: hypothetical protein H0U53_08185 [Actinobacteria bacterium]|nr:hypothetical protein [Actinomycetota bacterium]